MKKNNVISSPVTGYAKTAAGNAVFFVRLLLALSLIACNSPAGPAGKTGKAGADGAQGNQENQGNTGATGKKGTDATVIIEQEE